MDNLGVTGISLAGRLEALLSDIEVLRVRVSWVPEAKLADRSLRAAAATLRRRLAQELQREAAPTGLGYRTPG